MCGTALKCHLCFSAAAPKVSQSQAQSDVAISKPFPVMGGHPVPESGLMQSQDLVRITIELPSFDMACFFLQVPSFLWLWALSLPLCCCSWSAVVSDLFVTNSRKPVPSQQRSLITSSMACTCSQSGREVIWETGTLMWSPGAWRKTFLLSLSVFPSVYCL